MKNLELLSPVSNLETLMCAINGGADAVYLGGLKFGARAFCKNFDNNDMIEAIKVSHLYNVKIYVTLNTIIYENEVNEFIDYVKFLHENNVDAVIMQDIGMISLIHQIFPNLEIHLSTQFHNYTSNNINLLKSMGIKRVVCARELNLDEINKISEKIETEAFIHGSLCISYSGRCYMSYLSTKRSANRGECSQNCRLKYDISNTNIANKHILSSKDLCTVENIDKIIKSGVTSLKIEGRMKSPTYIYLVTKLYRTTIDTYNKTGKVIIDKYTYEDLIKEFNRGYTNGFILNDENIVNDKKANHAGINIGKVINITNEKIRIRLSKDLSQFDGLKFENQDKGMIVNRLYKDNKLVNSASINDIIELDNTINLKVSDNVLRTLDYKLSNITKKMENKRIPINLEVECLLNQPLKITYWTDKTSVTVVGDIVMESINMSATKENIISKLKKLNDTVFTLHKSKIYLDDNVFVSVSELNNLRRKCLEEIYNNILTIPKIEIEDIKYTIKPKTDIEKNINFEVTNEKQLIYILNKNIGYIYTKDYTLYEKYKYTNKVFYKLSVLNNNLVSDENIIISNIYNITNSNMISEYFLNITNSFGIDILEQLGIKKITLSIELENTQVKDILGTYINNHNRIPLTEIIVYGKIQVMTLKYNLLNNYDLNENNIYTVSTKKDSYEIQKENDYTKINSLNKINRLEDINYYFNNNVTDVRIILENETIKDIEDILKKIH